MGSIAVERSIWIDAPRERVWQAVTDPDEIARWFLPPAFGFGMKRDEGGTLVVTMGEMGTAVARLEGLDAPRQVTCRSLPDNLLATTYTLEAENDGTRVTIRMTGFEALPEDAARDRLEPSGKGWTMALENLKAYVEGQSLPHPEDVITMLYGYRRESPKLMAVERSIWINAPRERVWRAITDPDEIARWFSPGTQWRGTGLKVGGTLSVYNPETDTDSYTQVIDLVDPPRRLVTRSAPPEVAYVTTWTLDEENNGTRLTITHSGYELAADDGRHISMEQNAFGFGMMLENVKAQVEGASLPFPMGF